MRTLSPSGFKDMMTQGRSKTEYFGLTAKSYAKRIAAEMVGVQFPDLNTPEIRHGINYEFEAILAYEKKTGNQVTIPQDRIVSKALKYVSGLPDGLVGTDGIIEVKCPNLTNHLDNVLEGAQLAMYDYQIQGYLWLTDRQWCDFVSYSPAEIMGYNDEIIARCPERLQIGIIRVDRNEEVIAALTERMPIFWNLVMEYKNKLVQL
jgi:hypothetical protein